MADEILNRVIQIEELTDDGRKINVKEGRDKFNFWKTKMDGDNTKAFESYKSFAPGVGDFIEIAYKEEDAEFVNGEGRMVKFKRRTILNIKPSGGPSSGPQGGGNTGYTPGAKMYAASPPTTSLTEEDVRKIVEEMLEEKLTPVRDSFITLAEEVKELQDKDNPLMNM